MFKCPVARQCFALANIPLPVNGFSSTSFILNFSHILRVWNDERLPETMSRALQAPWVLWLICKNRNAVVLTGQKEESCSVESYVRIITLVGS